MSDPFARAPTHRWLTGLTSLVMLLPALLSTWLGYRHLAPLGAGSWQATDWGINYVAGFVRRGLAGSLLHQLASSHGVFSLNKLAFLVAALAVWSAALFVVLSTRRARLSTRLALALAPSFYPVFFLWAPDGGGRKEALAIPLIVALALLRFRKARWNAISRTLLSIALLPALVLSHESLFFLCAPFVVAAVALDAWSRPADPAWPARRRWRSVAVLSLLSLAPSLIALAAALLHSQPSLEQVEAICRSWSDLYAMPGALDCRPLPSGFQALAMTERFGKGDGSYRDFLLFSYRDMTIYGQWALALLYGLLLAAGCLVPAVLTRGGQPGAPARRGTLLVVLLLSATVLLFNLPLYALAIDYGRWMATSLTLLVVFGLGFAPQILACGEALADMGLVGPWPWQLAPALQTRLAPLIVLFWNVLAWIPHCCVRFWDPQNLSQRLGG